MNNTVILQKIIDALYANTYLEIGVGKGTNFIAIKAPFKAGVDPITIQPAVQDILNDKCRYYSVTSDNFFSNFDGIEHSENTVPKLFDVVFVDGLHEYRQVFRDICNALNSITELGFICVHGCKPTDALVAASPDKFQAMAKAAVADGKKPTGAWVGDVWKAIVLLRSLRKDVNVFTLNCAWGTAVITKSSPDSILGYSEQQIADMTFDDFTNNVNEFLNLKPPHYLESFLSNYKKADNSVNLRALLSQVFGGHVANALSSKEYSTKVG